MTLPLILVTAALAGLSAAALFWFGTDLAQKLRHTMAQRRRAKKIAAEARSITTFRQYAGFLLRAGHTTPSEVLRLFNTD